MTTIPRGSGLVSLCALLCGCVSVQPFEQSVTVGGCHFTYSDAFVRDVIEPRLKAHFPIGYQQFNLRAAHMVRRGKNVHILVDFTDMEHGVAPLDTPVVLFVIDPCTGAVLKELD